MLPHMRWMWVMTCKQAWSWVTKRAIARTGCATSRQRRRELRHLQWSQIHLASQWSSGWCERLHPVFGRQGFSKPLVHLIDREGESVRLIRRWEESGSYWLVWVKDSTKIDHEDQSFASTTGRLVGAPLHAWNNGCMLPRGAGQFESNFPAIFRNSCVDSYGLEQDSSVCQTHFPWKRL